MFADFDPKLMNNPDFKEDSVREVIITPMLTRLGYTPSGTNRILRSKTLQHPFINIGTRQHPVNIIPDYTLMIDDKPFVIIDAKRPTELTNAGRNVHQAYSYAIHPEVRCHNFALCNGKFLTVYNILDPKPILHIGFDEFESRWADIEKAIGPKYLKEPALRKFAPDLGLAFRRLGLSDGGKVMMYGCKLNIFGAVNSKIFTASAECKFMDAFHCVSVDFDRKFLPEILSCLPAKISEQFISALNRSPFQAAAELRIELDLDMRLGRQIDLEHESFVPLIVERVISSRFNPCPEEGEAKDIPKHIFRLSQSYEVKRK